MCTNKNCYFRSLCGSGGRIRSCHPLLRGVPNPGQKTGLFQETRRNATTSQELRKGLKNVQKKRHNGKRRMNS